MRRYYGRDGDTGAWSESPVRVDVEADVTGWTWSVRVQWGDEKYNNDLVASGWARTERGAHKKAHREAERYRQWCCRSERNAEIVLAAQAGQKEAGDG